MIRHSAPHSERAKRRAERRRQHESKRKGEFAPEPTFDEFASDRLDDLFEALAKRLTTRLCSARVVAQSRQPRIVSAANRRLLDYAQEVVDNAMTVQTRAGGCRDFVGECPEVAAEERRVRSRVADELAAIAKRVLPVPLALAEAARADTARAQREAELDGTAEPPKRSGCVPNPQMAEQSAAATSGKRKCKKPTEERTGCCGK